MLQPLLLSFHQQTRRFGRFTSDADSYQMGEANVNVSDRNITYYVLFGFCVTLVPM